MYSDLSKFQNFSRNCAKGTEPKPVFLTAAMSMSPKLLSVETIRMASSELSIPAASSIGRGFLFRPVGIPLSNQNSAFASALLPEKPHDFLIVFLIHLIRSLYAGSSGSKDRSLIPYNV
jgi:hypothetical protein